MIDRKVYPLVPPMVEYSLTPIGRLFIEPIEMFYAWAAKNDDALSKLRRRRKKRTPSRDKPRKVQQSSVTTRPTARIADQLRTAPFVDTSAFPGANPIAGVESGNHLALALETRCLIATAVKLGCHPWRAGTAQFRSDWSAIWVYNPRNGILMQHGFEESGDVHDIRLVVDTIPTLAWSARPDGSAEFFNQRWLDYTGLSAEQALGSGWQVAIHPDDLPRILETFQEALNSVKPYEVEGRFRRFDGEFRWFLFRGSPLRDRSGKVAKWYGTNTDLEERKRAEEALRKSEERWRSVFENSAIGVAVTDLNARYLATNNVYQTIVGYTEEELRALDFLSLTHEDYREANWALITELVEGKRRQFQIEKKYRRKDGSLVWVSNNVSLVPGTERVPRFIMAL
ncbi:MAG TPA: PAS domain S-box protein, partial [Bryobacteraceae bacterium]|nr:PAS domain S-box protein [Bryobacteraceae bacterium]